MGYHRAGFEVVGVDLKSQPRYPFEFYQGDALAYLDFMLAHPGSYAREYDAIHASPPCQAYSVTKHLHPDKVHPDLLEPTRRRLIALGLPYVIENVPGAPMNAIQLCGSSFGLGVEVYDGWRELRRHRLFESNVYMLAPMCQHRDATIGIYGDHARDRRRALGSRGIDFPDKSKLRLGKAAMDMPWCDDWKGLSQAIPPAYTEWIGTQLLNAIQISASSSFAAPIAGKTPRAPKPSAAAVYPGVAPEEPLHNEETRASHVPGTSAPLTNRTVIQ